MINVLIYSTNIFLATAVSCLCKEKIVKDKVTTEHCQSYQEVLQKAKYADFVFYDDEDNLLNTIRKLHILKRTNPNIHVLSLKNGRDCDFENIVYSSLPSAKPFKKMKISFLENKIKNLHCRLNNVNNFSPINDRGERKKDIPKLTQRENLILKLILKGRRNCEISRSLDISEKSVSAQRRNIYRKTSVNKLSELYQLFM